MKGGWRIDGHSYQSAKLTDAMIHMHHIVAHLELLNLLQRQRHLTTTGLVALEVVLMEAVENLMVGEEARFQVVVGKALVEGFVDRDDRGRWKVERGRRIVCRWCILFARSKNFLQAFLLLGAVCQDIEFKALQQIVLKGLRQELKVLVEQGLGLDVEADFGGW